MNLDALIDRLLAEDDRQGALSDENGYGELDRKIIDLKPDRSLANPDAVHHIAKFLENTRFIPYSQVPFFREINRLQGTPDADNMEAKPYVAARDALFSKQAVVRVPLDKLVVTQHTVNKDRIQQLIDDPSTGGNAPIQAVRYKGDTYVLNGHHRVVAAIKRGDRDMPAQLLNLDRDRVEEGKAEDRKKVEGWIEGMRKRLENEEDPDEREWLRNEIDKLRDELMGLCETAAMAENLVERLLSEWIVLPK